MVFWREAENKGNPFETARELMVERQLIPRGIKHPAVLDAMRTVPRHEFVPEERRDRAYHDGAMPIGQGQTISQPYMVAAMTQELFPKGSARHEATQRIGTALEVGGGSGYQAAVLAQLAHRVITIERVHDLAQQAHERLVNLGYDNVEVVEGDGTLGLAHRAPFDAILVAAAAPGVPDALKEQLALGGRMVLPVGSRGLQQLVIITREASGFRQEEHTRCVFVPLIGEQGWPG